MAESPTSSSPASPTFPLPDGHLALVVDDVVAELDASSGAPAPNGPDPRRALLYGWATGATTARELALRSATDDGLRYLLQGATPPFSAIRTFREENQQELEGFYASAFELIALAGLGHLGQIPLPGSANRDPAAYRRLARELLSSAASADLRDDRVLGETVQGDELPGPLSTPTKRQQAFSATRTIRGISSEATTGPVNRQARSIVSQPVAAFPVGTSSPITPLEPLTVEPQPLPAGPATQSTARRGAPMDVLAVIVTFVVVFIGMVIVRWLASASGPANEGRAGAQPPANVASATATVTPIPDSDDEGLSAARDEAVRLAGEALDDDDLQTARDLYFLASQAVSTDEEVANRLRQLDAALNVGNPQRDWDDTVTDLADLRVAAPDSNAVLQSYVSALVGAGRAALTARDPQKAASLCGEAVRWYPQRDDARSCLILSGGAPSATPLATATPAPTIAATPTPAPTNPPTATAGLGPATPIGLATPDPTVADSVRDTLQVSLTSTCQGEGDDGGILRLTGNVTSAGAPVLDYQLLASAIPPTGGPIPIANSTGRTSIFVVQQRVETSGAYQITVSVEKDGYAPAQASARVTC